VLLLLAGCVSLPAPESSVPLVVHEAPDESLMNLVTAALVADARLEPATPLYAEGATLIANGEARHFPPRYAGLAPGGEIGISSSRVEIRQDVAWVFVEYRWISTAEASAREGVASFVLVPATGGGAGWRILHAHSSSPQLD
jgi:hypothetical protein